MKERMKKILLEKYKISYDTSEELFSEGLLNERACIKFLIKNEYHDLMSRDGHIAAKVQLAEKYFTSSSTIERYIYRNN